MSRKEKPTAVEIYRSPDNQLELQVNLDKDTVWLTQAQMAELFERNRVAITQHIGNIFKEGELEEKLVCKNFLQTTPHGAIKGKTQSKTVKCYNQTADHQYSEQKYTMNEGKRQSVDFEGVWPLIWIARSRRAMTSAEGRAGQ